MPCRDVPWLGRGVVPLAAGGSYDVLWMLGMAINARGEVAEANLDVPAH
jgi:hypothetical protein